MNIPAYQSLSLVAQTAAFGVLDYSDRLNNLTSRITGRRVNRNTLAEGILNSVTDLALDISSKNKTVGNFAEQHAGMKGETLIKHAGVILLGKKDTVSNTAAVEAARSAEQAGTVACATTDDEFSSNVDELLTKVLEQQIRNGNIVASDVAPAHDLLRSLINDHLGKQVIQQFLGTVSQSKGWDALTKKIQDAVVPDGTYGFTNLLMMAGVRAVSGIAHSLINRGIVESVSFQTPENKPEVRLAANCLNAYLTDEFNCVEALENYKPSKGLINEKVINNVAELAPTLADHMVKRAKGALATAEKQLNVQKAKLESDKYQAGKIAGEHAAVISEDNATAQEQPQAIATDDNAGLGDAVELRQDQDIEESDWVVLDEAPQRDFAAATNNAAPAASNSDDGIDGFVVPGHSALDKAQVRLNKAEKNLKSAQQIQEMSVALKDLLVSDPSKQNNERITNALNVVLKSFLGQTSIVPTSLAGHMLQGGQGLPVQNVLGTYIAKYGWENLETMLDKAVETHLANLHALYAEEAQEAQRSGKPDHNKHTPSWAEKAIPKLAVKLAVPHLKLYFGDGKEIRFDRQGDDHYEMLAELLKANQDDIAIGQISSSNLIKNSGGIIARYLAKQGTAAAQQLGTRVIDNTRQLANATADYASSAAQMGTAVVNTAQQIHHDISENGVAYVIANSTIQATVATVGLTLNTARYTFSAVGNMLGMGSAALPPNAQIVLV